MRLFWNILGEFWVWSFGTYKRSISFHADCGSKHVIFILIILNLKLGRKHTLIIKHSSDGSWRPSTCHFHLLKIFLLLWMYQKYVLPQKDAIFRCLKHLTLVYDSCTCRITYCIIETVFLHRHGAKSYRMLILPLNFMMHKHFCCKTSDTDVVILAMCSSHAVKCQTFILVKRQTVSF